MSNANTLNSHPRLQELFEHPNFSGTSEEYERLKRTQVHVVHAPLDGIIDVICPYCTWTNTHNIRGGGGHRECDGPVKSKYTARCAVRRNNQMYDCPGYTLVIEDTIYLKNECF